MSRKILVCEDDASLRAVIRLVLELGGYGVEEASNGRAALELLDQELPDLILVDAKMPVLTGAELIAQIRAEPSRAAIPIVLLTGLPGSVPDDVRADAIVAKPFEKNDLLNVIGGLLQLPR